VETQVISRKSILVVEDEPSIARVCVRTLTGEGYAVETVVNGKIARGTLGKRDYDLYIVDVRTPEMNGMELYEEMKKIRLGLADKVLFTTGDTLSGNIKEFLDETRRPYLPKPFTPDELRVLVKTALQ
jgi:DNA-binding response OmpR family regulator